MSKELNQIFVELAAFCRDKVLVKDDGFRSPSPSVITAKDVAHKLMRLVQMMFPEDDIPEIPFQQEGCIVVFPTLKRVIEELRSRPRVGDLLPCSVEDDFNSVKRFLTGEFLRDLLPAWLCAELGLPAKPHAAEANLVEHRMQGQPLRISVGDKSWLAADLLSIVNEYAELAERGQVLMVLG